MGAGWGERSPVLQLCRYGRKKKRRERKGKRQRKCKVGAGWGLGGKEKMFDLFRVLAFL